jgi:hypothetical protein
MNSLTDPAFAGFIKKIKVKDHKVKTRSKKLLGLTNRAHMEELTITRDDLFKEKDSIDKLKQILLWGYPRGISKFVPELLKDKKTLETINKKLSGAIFDKTDDLFSLISNKKEIKNIGPVTLSKFAYFYGVKIKNKQALILDRRIIEAADQWKEISNIGLSGATFTPEQYSDYMDEIHKAAGNNNCDADQIETFLFWCGGLFRESP